MRKTPLFFISPLAFPVPEKIDLGYVARDIFVPYHARRERFACLVAHRRAGKTVACIMDLIDAALRCKAKNPRFAYVAPLYNQAKRVAWDYVQDYCRKIPGAEMNQAELRADLPGGGRIRLYGADNPDNLRGEYFDGVVLDEAADMSPRVWSEVIRPALSDRKGWATFIGTPKGENEFYDIYQRSKTDPDWYSIVLKASETGVIDADELRMARHDMTPEQYAQEYECSFSAAVIGSYYGREMDAVEQSGRISNGLYDPYLQVHTAWDIGLNDQTVIVFWQERSGNFQPAIIDCYANNGVGLDHYAKVLREKGYLYGDHIWPHDGAHGDWSVIGGQSRVATAQALGLPVRVLPRSDVADGINSVRRLLAQVWFDGEKTADLRKALRLYRREFDDVRNVFKDRPYHNWTSDYADAVRYMAIGRATGAGGEKFKAPDRRKQLAGYV